MSQRTPHRSKTRRTTAAAATALWLLASAAALAEDGSSQIPRRPDGRPDLSGTYDVATLTPLLRPARFGEKLTLDDREAKE
ncbi:MAG TPA: hypothetical protein VMM83_01050, partial [Longimicrobiales bacterium]|nr:hypothetical protein [Longimicrobiales bacterium]